MGITVSKINEINDEEAMVWVYFNLQKKQIMYNDKGETEVIKRSWLVAEQYPIGWWVQLAWGTVGRGSPRLQVFTKQSMRRNTYIICAP